MWALGFVGERMGKRWTLGDAGMLKEPETPLMPLLRSPDDIGSATSAQKHVGPVFQERNEIAVTRSRYWKRTHCLTLSCGSVCPSRLPSQKDSRGRKLSRSGPRLEPNWITFFPGLSGTSMAGKVGVGAGSSPKRKRLGRTPARQKRTRVTG